MKIYLHNSQIKHPTPRPAFHYFSLTVKASDEGLTFLYEGWFDRQIFSSYEKVFSVSLQTGKSYWMAEQNTITVANDIGAPILKISFGDDQLYDIKELFNAVNFFESRQAP